MVNVQANYDPAVAVRRLSEKVSISSMF